MLSGKPKGLCKDIQGVVWERGDFEVGGRGWNCKMFATDSRWAFRLVRGRVLEFCCGILGMTSEVWVRMQRQDRGLEEHKWNLACDSLGSGLMRETTRSDLRAAGCRSLDPRDFFEFSARGAQVGVCAATSFVRFLVESLVKVTCRVEKELRLMWSY